MKKLVLFLILTLAISGCQLSSLKQSAQIDKEAFIKMADNAVCADKLNKLYIIDKQYVFWEREGSCYDAAGSSVLYGARPDEVLCSLSDTIAGPSKTCSDKSKLKLFDKLMAADFESNTGLDDISVQVIK